RRARAAASSADARRDAEERDARANGVEERLTSEERRAAGRGTDVEVHAVPAEQRGGLFEARDLLGGLDVARVFGAGEVRHQAPHADLGADGRGEGAIGSGLVTTGTEPARIAPLGRFPKVPPQREDGGEDPA